MDVTTLQGEELGRVNMNKLKPYQEPQTTQAYALQILACHLLEAELRAKKPQTHDDSHIPQTALTPSKQETISCTESTYHPDQATLDAEDLEIHRIMLESYHIQPVRLRKTTSPHPPNNGVTTTQKELSLVKLKEENMTSHTTSEGVLKELEHAYTIPPTRKRGGEVHFLN